MYQDASYYVAPQLTDAGFNAFGAHAAAAPAPAPVGLGWRHAATLVLLLVSLPVFAVAALACLPVLLVVGGGEGLRRLLPVLQRR
jgi:hypothetical protein